MADSDKLISIEDNGVVCICFRNNRGLSFERIHKIFSEYGKVVGINTPGNEYGYRFIRYSTKEEALKCVFALKNHPDIRFEPVRSKNKESDGNSHSNYQNGKRQSSVNERRNNQLKFNVKKDDEVGSTKSNKSSVKSMNNDTLRNNRNCNDLNGFSNSNDMHAKGIHCETVENNSEKVQQSSSNDQCPNKAPLSARLERNYLSQKFDNKVKEMSINLSYNAARLAELRRLRGSNANTFQPSSKDHQIERHKNIVNIPVIPGSFIPISQASSSLSSHNSSKNQSMIPKAPPPLVSSVEEKQAEILVACDVVVANIHSNLGVSDIYKLFQNFNPIHISDIENVPKINIRFCHIYFQTLTEASEVVQRFDRAIVCGQNLITLRAYTLELEADVY